MPVTAQLAELLAASRPGEDGAGYIAFAVVAALFVAAWFLFRSLRHHLGKIDFEQTEQTDRSTDVRPDRDPPTA